MIKIFHGTSLKSAQKIIKDGEFKANMGTGVGSWTQDYIYFGTEFGVASAHGYGAGSEVDWEEKGSDPYIIFEMDVDENLLLPDYDNNSECKTWKESANKNGQVCIKNNLKLNKNTIIYLIGGEEFNLRIKTDINDFEEFYNKHKKNLYVPPAGLICDIQDAINEIQNQLLNCIHTLKNGEKLNPQQEKLLDKY
jgi:hypothetical protein